MVTGGETNAGPMPRKPRRRRLSRRRFWRRTAGGVLLVALVVVGFGPAMRLLGYWPRHSAEVTMNWDLVRISQDRRSVVIRVDECGVDYAGADVMRVGANVQLTVSTRADDDAAKISCTTFAHMPTHVVHLGFVLPTRGYVLASGCPETECGDAGA
jgi:hypothetical protein